MQHYRVRNRLRRNYRGATIFLIFAVILLAIDKLL